MTDKQKAISIQHSIEVSLEILSENELGPNTKAMSIELIRICVKNLVDLIGQKGE